MFSVLTQKLSDLKLKFLLLLGSGYMASFLCIQGIQSLMPFIQSEFGISRTQAGLYSTSLFITATIIAVFSGGIVDRIGSRKGLIIGVSSLGVIMLLHGFAPFYSLILVLALLAGLGFSIITPAVNKALMYEVAPSRRAVSMGIMHSGSGVGGFAGATLLPILAGFFGWRPAIILAGGMSIITGLIVSRRYNVNGSTAAPEDNAGENTRSGFWTQFKNILKNEQLMLACSLGLVFGLAVGAIPAHYTLYLTLDLQYSEAMAGFALGLAQLGGIFGRILWGWVSDVPLKGDRKNAFMLIMVAIVSLKLINAFGGDMLSSHPLFMLAVSLLLGVSALGWSGLFFTVVSERATAEQTGLASGVSLVFLRLGVVIGPILFGYLGDIFEHYHRSWLLLAGLVFASGLIYYLLQSRKDSEMEEIDGG